MHVSQFSTILVLFASFLGAAACAGEQAPDTPICAGIIGLDAHAVPWTEILTNPKTDPAIRTLKVVAAVPAYT